LSSSDPIIGQAVDTRIDGGLPGTVGGLLVSWPGQFVWGNCLVQLEFASMVTIAPVVIDAAGSWQSSGFVIGSSPTFVGLVLHAQAWAGLNPAVPLQVDVSNGLVWTLGL
jgi:hypothetical protein